MVFGVRLKVCSVELGDTMVICFALTLLTVPVILRLKKLAELSKALSRVCALACLVDWSCLLVLPL